MGNRRAVEFSSWQRALLHSRIVSRTLVPSATTVRTFDVMCILYQFQRSTYTTRINPTLAWSNAEDTIMSGNRVALYVCSRFAPSDEGIFVYVAST